jgi:hypothetical protein
MEKFRNTQTTVQNSISSIKKEADTIRKNVELEAEAASMSSKPSPAADTNTPEAEPAADTPATDTAADTGTAAETQKS